MFYKPLNDLYTTKKVSSFLLNLFEQKDENMDKYCFDCGRNNPELISINNGIYICKKCGMEHMLFPGGTSILTKNDIKTLTDSEIKYLKYGGNRQLYEFILNKYPSLLTLPRKFLYNSPILNEYQNQLQLLIKFNKEPFKNKRELYKNKLQINPNYSSNDINTFINPSIKRFNTTNSFNINDSIYDDNTFNSKKIKSNLNNFKLDDDIHNYVFTQRTHNTHANTISNSNTLSYISEKTNENNNNDYLNKCLDNKNKIIKKNKHFLKKTNIIYNKPKITNIINNIKNEQKLRSYRYNHSIDYFDNENVNNNNYINNYYFLNNTIDNFDSPNNLILKSKIDSFHKKGKNIFETINRNINYDNNELRFNKELLSDNRNSNNNLRNLRPRYSVNYSNRTINFCNDLEQKIEQKEEKGKSVQSERKIKEIIINKKIKKNNNDDIDNSKKNLNNTNLESKKLLENKPIQVNLKINTLDKSHNCHTYVDSYESLNYNNDKSEIASIEKKNNYKIEIKQFRRKMKKFNTTSLMQNHFNINTNLKKKFKQDDLINKNNSFNNEEKNDNEVKNDIEIKNGKNDIEEKNDINEKNDVEEKNDIDEDNIENNITFNKIKKYHSNNLFSNKNKWTCKTIKTIYYKNRVNTIINKTESIIKKSLTNDKNKNAKNEEKNKENEQEDIFKKDNITHFQILPIKKNIININKINNKKFYILKEKKHLCTDKEKSILDKKKNIKENNCNKNEAKLIRLNTERDKKFKHNIDLIPNSTRGIKFGETFKNSIRNRYKREKSTKKKD